MTSLISSDAHRTLLSPKRHNTGTSSSSRRRDWRTKRFESRPPRCGPGTRCRRARRRGCLRSAHAAIRKTPAAYHPVVSRALANHCRDAGVCEYSPDRLAQRLVPDGAKVLGSPSHAVEGVLVVETSRRRVQGLGEGAAGPPRDTLFSALCPRTIPSRVIQSQAARHGGRYPTPGPDSRAAGGRSPGSLTGPIAATGPHG